MRDLEKRTCRIGLVQAEPVLFDKKASLEKALAYIDEAAENGAELIVFPELFIPGYPVGMNFGFSVGKRSEPGREDWKRYYDASVVLGGDEFRLLAEAARKTGAFISIGFSERDAVGGTLYNSNAIFGPDGTYKVHRKLKPTGSERLVWGDADKNFFPVTETPWGPIGSLICWESYMPLARVALYQKGITIYISPNTNDNPEWQATIRHIAIEGKCYFINADMIIRKGSYPDDLNEKDAVVALPDMVCRGGSCIIDPYGHYVTDPVWDEETIIYAELDMSLPAACKMEHDAVGHYSRPDVLQLVVADK
jgi:nitrilase